MAYELLSTEDVGPIVLDGTPQHQTDESVVLGVAWFESEPERVGQIVPVAAGGSWVGRAEARVTGDPRGAASFVEQRPDRSVVQPPVATLKMSRYQLHAQPAGDDAVRVVNRGKRRLLHNDVPVTECTARVGDTLLVEEVALFLVQRRPPELARLAYHAAPDFAFGRPDAQGMVGESPAAWALRDQLAVIAMSDGHVLVRGETGVGKELAARTLHARSPRRDGPLIQENAAALPPGLIDAELFGHARDYPERGMPAREGLIAAAHRGHLLLDEFGQLPHALQAHLLRVLDEGGQFRRLGDTRLYRSDFRLIAVSNQELTAFKHDVLARFDVQLVVPGLNQRRSDIPLLIRHWPTTLDRGARELLRRFCPAGDVERPCLDPALVDALVRHWYTKHTRELFRLLGVALRTSLGDRLELTPEVLEALAEAAELAEAASYARGTPGAEGVSRREAPASPSGPPALNRKQIESALRATGGNKSQAAIQLGISRYALYRLLRRLS